MYFRDESCQSKISLQKANNLNVFTQLGADWAGIIILTKDGRVLLEEGHLSFSEVNVEAIIEFLHQHQNEFVKEPFASLEDAGEHYFTSFIREDDGYYVFITAHKKEPFSQEALAWYQIFNTISYEKVLLENTFAQREDWFRNVFESNVIGICNFDLAGTVVAFNEMLKQMFGRQETESTKWSLRTIPCVNEVWGQILQVVVEKQKRYYMERTSFLIEEDTHFYNLIIAPILSNKKQVLGMVMLCTDVTETIFLQEENLQLEQFALVGEVATGVAHDVRNPLMNIQSTVNVLKKYPLTEEERRESLDDITSEVERINEVVAQLLSYVDINENRRHSYFDVNEIINKAVAIAQRNRNSKYIDFVLSLERNIPLIWGRPTSLRQGILNMFLNSMQAISDYGRITVNSKFMRIENEVRIEVSDDGEGISYTGQKLLFKPFFSTKSDGIGFGLTILKRAVEEHHGRVEFHSLPEVGTTFYIFLPIIEEELS